jgi:hypothetical protein
MCVLPAIHFNFVRFFELMFDLVYQVPHDMLNLRQPVWVSALKYLDPSHTFVSGTAFHQVHSISFALVFRAFV